MGGCVGSGVGTHGDIVNAFRASRSWVQTVGFAFGGMVLLYLAYVQRGAMRRVWDSTFHMPTGRFFAWVVTMMIAGFMFGVAAAHRPREQSQQSAVALAIASLMPLAVLLYFYGAITLGWSFLPGRLSSFVYEE